MRYSPHAVPDERTREGHGRGGPSGDRGGPVRFRCRCHVRPSQHPLRPPEPGSGGGGRECSPRVSAMDEAMTTILGDARAAVDHLEAALSGADANAHRKAKQDFSYGVEELVAVLIAAPPDASEVATACAIIAAGCRVARAHGERVAADTNPAEIAIVDAWYIGEVLRRVPEERLPPAVRGQLLHALDTLREFDAPRVRKMIQSNRRMSDREVDEFLRNR